MYNKKVCSLYSNGVWIEVDNVDKLATNVTLQVKIKKSAQNLSLWDKIKKALTHDDDLVVFTLDRTQTKNLSSFIYGEITAADKAYKEAKLKAAEKRVERTKRN